MGKILIINFIMILCYITQLYFGHKKFKDLQFKNIYCNIFLKVPKILDLEINFGLFTNIFHFYLMKKNVLVACYFKISKT